MKPGAGNRQYIFLALLMTFVLYSIYEVLTFVHELGHGLTALSLGGYFPFVQVDADGGRSIFFFPLGSPSWKEALVLLAGPTFNFLAAVFVLGILAVGVKSRRSRLLLTLVGGVSSLMVINVTGLFPPWWRNYKETGQALEMLGFTFGYEAAIKSVWFLLGALLVVSFFRLFFKEVSADFPTTSYRQRLALVTSVLIAPGMVIMGALSVVMLRSGFGEGVINPRRHWPHVLLLLGTFALLPLLVTSGKSDEPLRFAVSRKYLLGWASAAAAIAISQAVVFGNDRSNPRGLFLTNSLPEVAVESCNLVVTLGGDNKAHVQLLMRPFAEAHNFLWAKANNGEPADWAYYEKFARANLPVVLGTDNFRIVGHHADRSIGFFNGSWGIGARVVEAEAETPSLVAADAQAGQRVLTLVDFWRKKGVGYIDFTEINVQNGLRIKDIREDPSSASPPILLSRMQLQWTNTNLPKAFATAYVTLE